MATIPHLNTWQIYSWSREKKDDIIKLGFIMSIIIKAVKVILPQSYSTTDLTKGLVLEMEKNYLWVYYLFGEKQGVAFFFTLKITSIFCLPGSPGEELFIHTYRFSFCLCFVGDKVSHHLKMGSFHTWAVPYSLVPTPLNSSEKSRRSMATFSLAK